MPLARDKPYLFVDGKKEDVSGASAMAPEWNQEDLLQGNRLLELLQFLAEIPDEGEPGASPGCDAFADLCLRAVPFAHGLVSVVKSQLPRDVYNRGFVMLLPGKNFAKEYLANKMVPDLQKMLDDGMAVPCRVWEALLLRLTVVLGCAAMCLDHFRVEVMGKETYKAVGPQMGCAGCGAVELKDGSGGRLLACGACGYVFYCGKECQKAHWKEHKPECKPKPKDKTPATPATVAGAGTSAAAAAAAGRE